MDISVIWVPDQQSQEKMRSICRHFRRRMDESVGSYPHITLGNYYDIPFDLLNDQARAFVLCIERFKARFIRYKLLNDSCMVMEAEYLGRLKSYYELFHEKLDEYADKWTCRKNGLYLPHCTVLNAPGEDVAQIMENEQLDPFDITIVKLQLSRMYEGPRYEILSSFDLD